MRIRTSRAASVAAVWAALGVAPLLAPLSADDVHLVNGNAFEGVIATVEGSLVKIRLPHGELSLPLSRVQRIDKSGSSLEEYLGRKTALLSSEQTRAEDWLELARWAETHQLAHGVRESALRAAALDPMLEGLAPVLRGLGYLYQEDLDRWLPYAEAMHHRGFVYYDGAWVTRETYEARVRAEEEARRQVREQVEERLAERTAQAALETAIEARVQAEVARELAAVPVRQGFAYATPVVVGTFYPGFVTVGSGEPSEPPAPARDAFNTILNPFDPPPSQILLERDFGGGLGTRLPDGYAGAPGRVHQMHR
jgi:hypothetical protein